MKTIYIRLSSSKLLSALIFSAAISVLSISPAFADRDEGHGWRGGDRGHQEWRGDRDRGHQEWRGDRDRGHHEWRGDRDGYGYGYGYAGGYQPPRYQQPYGYAQPVYVPPPVYYPLQQSPGINIILPLNFR